MNESWHIQRESTCSTTSHHCSFASSPMNESCHISTRHGTYESFMAHMRERYGCVMDMNASWRKGQRAPAAPPPTAAPALHAHMNKSCHISMSDGTYEVMAEMREATFNTNSPSTRTPTTAPALHSQNLWWDYLMLVVCTQTNSHVSAHTHTVMAYMN